MNKEVSFSKVAKAIADWLRGMYPDYPVYRTYPEEGLSLPCFVLRTSGGNIKKRIANDYARRGITYERFTLEFYSLDIGELQDMGYDLRVYLDTVEADDGELYRCYNKNAMMALTENHVSVTFRVHTEPYMESPPQPKMDILDIEERLT